MNIDKSNELIAEFMGKSDQGMFFVKGDWYYPDSLRYHTSWDWLMEVVGKIITIDDKDFDLVIKIGNEDDHTVLRTRNMKPGSAWSWDVVICEETVGLITVYKTVVAFINWYNKKKKDGVNKKV
jgi:hypothetical protein